MIFVKLTRPDDTPVAIRIDDILSLAPVPADPKSVEAGPLTVGTRITYKGGSGHQDVKELLDEVLAKIGVAG